jgi:hypothetical protein
MTEQGSAVEVHLNGDGAIMQPNTFRCCPLGLQFYAKKELPDYRVLHLKVEENDGADRPFMIDCNGVVVHSQFESERNMYRIWVVFMDVEQETRDRLHCIARENDTLCPHCMNF